MEQISITKMKEYIYTNHMNIRNIKDKINILNIVMKFENEYNTANDTDIKLVIDEKDGIRIHLNEIEKLDKDYITTLYNLVYFIINNKETPDSPDIIHHNSSEDEL